jgi:hypothetical protein
MDLVKDSLKAFKRGQENGLFLTEIEDRFKMKEQDSKLTDITLSIWSNNTQLSSILIT